MYIAFVLCAVCDVLSYVVECSVYICVCCSVFVIYGIGDVIMIHTQLQIPAVGKQVAAGTADL